jgi:hypothetical protein
MADPTHVTGSELLWSYSTDSGSTYKTVVCQISANLDASRNVNTAETACGTFKAFGPSNYKLNFTGTVDTAPDTGEGSWTELLTLFEANTAFMSKFATAGNEPYITGTGKLASLQLQNGGPSDIVQFSAAFEFSGTVDITP